jgi:nitrate/nitrite transport system ATP-binding protein
MEKTGATVVMVTHDVDEAVLLSDRIVMMTNGPAATIGEIDVEVEAAGARPRSPTTARPCSSSCIASNSRSA